jgi:hypothetical protein
MRARALVALGGRTLTREEIAAGGLDHCDRADITGEPVEPSGDTRADWETAKALCPVPEGGMILYWLSDE